MRYLANGLMFMALILLAAALYYQVLGFVWFALAALVVARLAASGAR